jgi:DNA transposition AAA+ family ATPase
MNEELDTHTTAKISTPGDQVQAAISRLVKDDEIDEAASRDIWWFYCHAMDRNWSTSDAGKAIETDGTTISRLFRGRYGARYDNLVASVRRYRSLVEARGGRTELGFVETTTWEKIEAVCRHALVSQAPVFIFGDSQIGKTTCLEEYARRNNHGQTRYIRMPAAPGFVGVQREVARACYLSDGLSSAAMRDRVMAAINDQMLLIVDEMHQALLPGAREGTAVRIVEWFREIYDRTRCGIVFVGTRVFRHELERGKLALVLEQFRRRGIIQLQLPATPPKADVAKIAKAFGLGAPEGIAADVVDGMLKACGLGQYVKFLQSASNLAAKQKKPMSWDHFVMAYDVVRKLNSGKEG